MTHLFWSIYILCHVSSIVTASSPPNSYPTPSPILDCASNNIDRSLNVSNWNDWQQIVYPSSAETDTFVILNDITKCYAMNPCIAMKGVAGINGGSDAIYVEQTLNVSDYTHMQIGLEVATFSLDVVAEYAFFETLCDSQTLTNIQFHQGIVPFQNYSNCFDFNVKDCDEFALRIGGFLSGSMDKIYLTAVSLHFETMTPTDNPTKTPTANPTSLSPTDAPTLLPTNSPSMAPSANPTQLCFHCVFVYMIDDGPLHVDFHHIIHQFHQQNHHCRQQIILQSIQRLIQHMTQPHIQQTIQRCSLAKL